MSLRLRGLGDDKRSQSCPPPQGQGEEALLWRPAIRSTAPAPMGIDFNLIANFAALALITLAGPAVIFILFYRRGAL
ncbi:MAG: photosystem II reaction center protein Ycf12 [Synechococcaceae cyanobacterium]